MQEETEIINESSRFRAHNALKTRRWVILQSVSPVSIGALALLSLLSINPGGTNKVNAAISKGCVRDEIGLRVDETTVSDTVFVGDVAYASKSVYMMTCGASSYTLVVSAPAQLKSASGTTALTGVGTNVAPGSMSKNTWGYAFGEGSDPSAMRYSSFTGGNQTLSSGSNLNLTIMNEVSGTLAIAAKFGDEAEAGHYTTQIHLSLIATPGTTTNSLTYETQSDVDMMEAQESTQDELTVDENVPESDLQDSMDQADVLEDESDEHIEG